MKKIIILYFFTTIFVLYAQEWKKLEPSFDPPDNYTLLSASFINGSVGYIAAFSPASIWKTTDGGNNWTNVLRVATDWLYSISFPDEQHGWAILENRATREYKLYSTTNEGADWTIKNPPAACNVVEFTDSLNGFLYCGPGIYATTDGGNFWVEQNIDFSAASIPVVRITDIFFTDAFYGWAIGGWSGGYGAILKTTDGGNNWFFHTDNTIEYRTVCFINRLIGFFASGTVARTTDAGGTWEYTFTGAPTEDMAVSNNQIVWGVGMGGKIIFTTNTGDTWQTYDTGITDDLLGIQFVEDGDVGYIWGMNNTLLKYESPVGIDEQSEVIPNKFSLEQNYPNPFNPTTTIKFQVTEPGLVTIKVYNMVGEEITTLISKNLESGIHRVEFDAGNLPSGVYIYTVNTINFRQSKKMILIK